MEGYNISWNDYEYVRFVDLRCCKIRQFGDLNSKDLDKEEFQP